MAVAPCSAASRASRTTEMPKVCRTSLASRYSPAGRTASSAARCAWNRMPVPSSPAVLVITTRSPGCIPAVVTRRSLATTPVMVPTTTGCVTAGVTSVWPPVTLTFNSRQATSICVKRSRTAASVADGGSSRPVWNHAGRAPMVATSLALTCTAYQPGRSVVNVTGSVVATRYRSPRSMTAQSSPKRGPMWTRGSGAPMCRRQVASRSGGSLPGGNMPSDSRAVTNRKGPRGGQSSACGVGSSPASSRSATTTRRKWSGSR